MSSPLSFFFGKGPARFRTRLFGTLQILFLVGAYCFAPSFASAAIPGTFAYQGELKNSSGTALTGTYTMTFRLYDALTHGALLWTEIQPGVTVDSGYFNVSLGSVSAFPGTLDFNQPLYFTIEINSDGEMSPRIPVASVAYAKTAGGIDSYGSAPATTAGGRMYYDTAAGTMNYYDGIGSVWRTLSIGGGVGTLQDVSDLGGATTNALQFAGGTSTAPFRFQSSLTVDGQSAFGDAIFVNATGSQLELLASIAAPAAAFTDVTSTNVYATNATTTNLAVSGGLSLPASSVTDAMAANGLTIDATGSVNASALNAGTLGNAGVVLALGSFGSITGTLADANVADALTVSGGTINGTAIGASSASTAVFTNATATSLAVSDGLSLPANAVTDAAVADGLTIDATGSVDASSLTSGSLGNVGVTLALGSFGSITGTLADGNVADALTISGGTVDGTAIGASAASTAVFTNTTSTNATTANLTVSGALDLVANAVTDAFVVDGLTIDATGSVNASSLNAGTLGNAGVILALGSFGSITGTLADANVADVLTISGGTIENTAIGAATPSTAVFTNASSTNAAFTNLLVATGLTLPANSVTDAFAANGLTIDATGSIDATAINGGTLGNAGVTLALGSFGSITGSLSDGAVADALTISGGSIDATAIGSGVASTAVFTNVTSTNATTTNLAVSGGLSLPGGSVTDAMVADGLTIDSTGTVNAAALTSGTLGDAGVTLALGSFGSITGSLADGNIADALTVSGGTINNTAIGALTPSTAVFTNVTSTNVTSTLMVASTSLTSPLVIGGTGTASALRLRSTSGVGSTGADIIFQTGSNGATEAMRILNSGNVGIAVANPGAKLEIQGASGSNAFKVTGGSAAWSSQFVYVNETGSLVSNGRTDSAGNLLMGAIGGSDTFARLGMGFDTGTPFLGFGPGSTARDVFLRRESGALAFTFGTTPSEKVRITSAGLVGIGTTNPGAKLHVAGSTGSVYEYITVDGTGINDIPAVYFATGYSGTPNYAGIGMMNDGSLRLTGANSIVTVPHLTITDAGNVGIGTPTPSSTFHLAGMGDITAIIEADADNSGENDNPVLVLRQDGNLVNGLVGINGDASPTGLFTDAIANATFVESKGSAAGVIQFVTGGTTIGGTDGTARVTIGATGNVGIGTNNPTGILHVVGGSKKTFISSTSNSFGQVQIGNPTGKETSLAFLSNASTFGDAPGSSAGSGFVWVIGNGVYSLAGSQFGIGNQGYNGPAFMVDTNGGAAIGSYAKSASTPPAEGLIVSGRLGVGLASPTTNFQVSGLTILTNPSGSGYNENLRLPPSTTNDYASIALGAVAGTSGTGAGQWNIIRFPTASFNNLFTIRHNSSDYFAITSTGSVGIGTTSPSAALHASSTTEQLRLGYNASNYSKFTVNSASGLTLTPGVNGTTAFNFTKADGTSSILNVDTTNGYVGIGQVSPSRMLHVGSTSVTDGTVLLRLQDANSYCEYDANTGSPTCASDRTLKRDIVDMDGNLEKIIGLRPVTYHWNTDLDTDAVKVGFIAQDVAEQIPELVTKGVWVDGTEKSLLNIGGMMPYVVGAIKEQQAMLGDIANIEGVSVFIEGVRNDLPRDVVSFVRARLAQDAKLLTDLVVARVTAIQGYFDKVHTKELCVARSDGAEVCVTGDQLQQLMSAQSAPPPSSPPSQPSAGPTPQPEPEPEPEPPATADPEPSVETPPVEEPTVSEVEEPAPAPAPEPEPSTDGADEVPSPVEVPVEPPAEPPVAAPEPTPAPPASE